MNNPARLNQMTTLGDVLGHRDETGRILIGNPNDPASHCWYCGAEPIVTNSEVGCGTTWWHAPNDCCEDMRHQQVVGKENMLARIESIKQQRAQEATE